MSVYSHRFMIAKGTGVFTTYTVPGGYRAVLKSIAGANENARAGNLWVYVGAVPVYFFLFPAETRGINVDTRLTFYGGEQMRVYTSHVDLNVVLNGYLFDDRLGAQGAPGDLKRHQLATAAPLPGTAPRFDREQLRELEAGGDLAELERQ